MQYRSDYVLRLVEQMGGLIRRAIALLNVGSGEVAYELSEEALSLVFDVDPDALSRLSSQTMISLLELEGADSRVVELVADALAVQADVLDRTGALFDAAARREQSVAVRSMLDPSRAN